MEQVVVLRRAVGQLSITVPGIGILPCTVVLHPVYMLWVYLPMRLGLPATKRHLLGSCATAFSYISTQLSLSVSAGIYRPCWLHLLSAHGAVFVTDDHEGLCTGCVGARCSWQLFLSGKVPALFQSTGAVSICPTGSLCTVCSTVGP